MFLMQFCFFFTLFVLFLNFDLNLDLKPFSPFSNCVHIFKTRSQSRFTWMSIVICATLELENCTIFIAIFISFQHSNSFFFFLFSCPDPRFERFNSRLIATNVSRKLFSLIHCRLRFIFGLHSSAQTLAAATFSLGKAFAQSFFNCFSRAINSVNCVLFLSPRFVNIRFVSSLNMLFCRPINSRVISARKHVMAREQVHVRLYLETQ